MTSEAARRVAELLAPLSGVILSRGDMNEAWLKVIKDVELDLAEATRAERERIVAEARLWGRLSSSWVHGCDLENFAKAIEDGKGPFNDESLNKYLREEPR